MEQISLQAKRLDISVVKGHALPPIPFKVVDAENNPVTAYVPVLVIHEPITGVETALSIGSGIGVKSDEFEVLPTSSLEVAEYRYALELTVSGMTLPGRSGEYHVKSRFDAGEEEPAVIELVTIKLPIIWNPSTSQYEFSPSDFSFSDFKINA